MKVQFESYFLCRFGMHLLIVFTLFMSLIIVIKTQDDCQIKSPGTNSPKACDFDKKHSIKKGCKRPNVSLLSKLLWYLDLYHQNHYRVWKEIQWSTIVKNTHVLDVERNITGRNSSSLSGRSICPVTIHLINIALIWNHF